METDNKSSPTASPSTNSSDAKKPAAVASPSVATPSPSTPKANGKKGPASPNGTNGTSNKKKAPPTSPRARTTGLSELARQLRFMQAKNETLNADVDRLERQLKILAELSNISVKDLQARLAQACESEAYGVLQSRLAKLQAQLDESELRAQRAKNSKGQAFQQEQDAQRIANLQLRIGELEEVEQNLRKELQDLYKSQSSRQQNSSTSKDSGVDDDVALQNNKQIEVLKSQVTARENDLELKEAQYKARFAVQENRIADMEQQLSSLYVAFDLLDKDYAESKQQVENLTSQLSMADTQVALAVDDHQRKNNSNSNYDSDDSFSGGDYAADLPSTPAQGGPPQTIVASDPIAHQQQLLSSTSLASRNSAHVIPPSPSAGPAPYQPPPPQTAQRMQYAHPSAQAAQQRYAYPQTPNQQHAPSPRPPDYHPASSPGPPNYQGTATPRGPRPVAYQTPSPVRTNAPPNQTTIRTPTGQPQVLHGYRGPPPTLTSQQQHPQQLAATLTSQQQHPQQLADLVLAQGFVFLKQGGRLGGWKKQYAFVRRGPGGYELVIAPATTPQNRKKGKTDTFPLTASRTTYVESNDYAPQYPHCLKIQTDAMAKQKKQNNPIVLAVTKEQDLDIWVVALAEATKQLSQRRLMEQQSTGNFDYDNHLRAAMAQSLREHKRLQNA